MTGSSLIEPWERLLLSRPLGDYDLTRCLGRGGFGYVFEATHARTGATFAVKVLKPSAADNADNVVDFENEGRLLQRLISCDRVIDYIEGGSTNFHLEATPGITVPVPIRFHVLAIASGSVGELTSDPVSRNSLDWTARLRLWRDVVLAVHQMHRSEITHRDLKAENCLLMIRGNVTRVKLADFGRAKDIASAPTRSLEEYLRGRGDMRFAPPEFLFLQGEADARDFVCADYYGLGSLLVELVSAQPLSALIFGDWRSVFQTAQDDLLSGRRRNLAGLAGHYFAVIADVVRMMPPSIQQDATILLRRLCDPEPYKRLESSPFGRDRLNQNPLDWIIRRIDIMVKRLEIEDREERRNRKTSS